jgi:hypothetical protein
MYSYDWIFFTELRQKFHFRKVARAFRAPTFEPMRCGISATRVARWFVFKPKIPIWEKFSGPQIGKY